MKGNREPNPRFWSGKRVCVTGGTGFLGHHLVNQLLDLGARVRVLALPPSPGRSLPSATAHVFGDLCDSAVVTEGLAGCEVIFHTAGLVAFWGPALQRMQEVHVEGTANVLRAAAPGARVVHTSSIVAVGASNGREALTEESVFNLDGVQVDYVHAKRAAEQIALAAAEGGRDVVVVNPSYLVGPEDLERSVMGRICRRFWKGRIPIAPPGGFNLVDVRDVARGHLLAAEHGRAGRRYILGGENHTQQDFLALLARTAGFRPRALPRCPAWTLHALAHLAEGWAWLTGREPCPSLQHARLQGFHWFYRSDRAERELGYRARPLVQSLAETWRWYASSGRLCLRGLNRWWMRPTKSASRDRQGAEETGQFPSPQRERGVSYSLAHAAGSERKLSL